MDLKNIKASYLRAGGYWTKGGITLWYGASVGGPCYYVHSFEADGKFKYLYEAKEFIKTELLK